MGIKKAEAARLLGVSRQAIPKMIASKELVQLPDGTLDPKGVEAAVKRRKGVAVGEGIDWDMVLKREKAKKARLERLEMQGLLVRRSAIEASTAAIGALVRDRLRQVGPRLAAALAAETDVRRCRDLVAEAVDRELLELAALGGVADLEVTQ